MSDLAEYDPRGLIREAYAIEGIGVAECRSIFLDWALFDDHSAARSVRIAALLDGYGAAHPDHPMTAILREGLAGTAAPKGRRGGPAARRGG